MNEVSDQVRNLRTDYTKGALVEAAVKANPIEQFQRWMDEAIAAEAMEANAMSLATANAAGQPSVRIVLLRGLDDRGFVFFTNYESHKGRDLEENPHASLGFFWPELERQVRIMGKVAKVSTEESDAYFNSRPRGSKIGAWASPQSDVIESRDLLDYRAKDYDAKYKNETVERPPHWGGYRLDPHTIEFWQGRESRLHDRIQYVQNDGVWQIQRLAP